MHVFNQFSIQVLENLNLLSLHSFVKLVSLLRVRFLAVMLNQHRVDIAHLDGIFNTRSIHKSQGNLCHAIRVTLIEGLTSLTELLEVSDLSKEHVLLLGFVCGITLVKLSFGLDHCFKGFFIRAEFIDLDLGTLIVEVGEALVRFSLTVELDDCLHDIRVVMPVLVSEEVACHYPHVSRTCSLGKTNDSTHIA